MKKLDRPKVTVLMPVYNGEAYLREAIDSILDQTYTNFEFLILNDGSTDRSVEIVRSYKDSRIRLVQNEKNLGLIDTLNIGIELSAGQYIARMDCDDVSMPERLSKQVSFMDFHPDVGVCGTWMETTGVKKRDILKYPVDDNSIKCRLIFEPVIAHPTVIMRKKLFEKTGFRYDKLYIHAEDYALWVRFAKHCSFANIGDVLVHYRLHQHQIGQSYLQKQVQSADIIRMDLLKSLGVTPTPEKISLHSQVGTCRFQAVKDFIVKANMWLLYLESANDKFLIYDKAVFTEALRERWFLICNKATALGIWIWKTYWQSSLSKDARLNYHQKIKFLLKSILKQKPAHHISQ